MTSSVACGLAVPEQQDEPDMLDDIKREAEARQKAIAELFTTPTKSTRAKKSTG